MAGCQNNNSQRDLVARELRMHEDQVYAMEDYINEYQQLLCKYRSENAALKRQLADGCVEVETPETSTTPRSKSPSGQRSRVVTPTTPKPIGKEPRPTLELPDVPPLQGTKPDGANLQFRQGYLGDNADSSGQPSGMVAASYSIPEIAGEAASDFGELSRAAAGIMADDHSPSDVVLRGEVVANDNGGGPRLVIQVEARDAAGGAQAFAGNASLMVLAIGEDGAKQNLGRWDFGPGQVQAGADPVSGAPILQFHLELPADTPITASNELWVRLLPRGGGKLLAKADVDLTQPGMFASQSDPPGRPVTIAMQIAEAANVDTVTPATFTMTSVGDDGWQLARPGEPANLPTESEKAENGWRATTEPLPEVVAQTAPAESPVRSKWPKRTTKSARVAAATAASTPSWSPNRPGESAAVPPTSNSGSQAARSHWSATR